MKPVTIGELRKYEDLELRAGDIIGRSTAIDISEMEENLEKLLARRKVKNLGITEDEKDKFVLEFLENNKRSILNNYPDQSHSFLIGIMRLKGGFFLTRNTLSVFLKEANKEKIQNLRWKEEDIFTIGDSFLHFAIRLELFDFALEMINESSLKWNLFHKNQKGESIYDLVNQTCRNPKYAGSVDKDNKTVLSPRIKLLESLATLAATLRSKAVEQEKYDIENGFNLKGQTPLFVAASKGFLDLVQNLIEKESTIYSRDVSTNSTPFEIAKINYQTLASRADHDLSKEEKVLKENLIEIMDILKSFEEIFLKREKEKEEAFLKKEKEEAEQKPKSWRQIVRDFKPSDFKLPDFPDLKLPGI